MTIQTDPQLFSLSDNAVKRVAFLLEQEADADKLLRVWVTGGGCSGFQYHFDFDTVVKDDDMLLEQDGARVAVDEMSLELLKGGQLDFVEDLMGAYFTVSNPNATSSCGCGVSFSI
jgi:iron-sulfur cluster insertion protein